jgi:Kef-type K+ transport system membrane component KefB
VNDPGDVLITLGLVLLLGLATDAIGRYTRLPRVTLLLVFGLIVGPGGLDLLPPGRESWFPVAAHVALVMVGFLLGEQFTPATLHTHGRQVLWMSLGAALVTALLVAVGLTLLGTPLPIALLLGGIATATDPAATHDVVRETRARGPFTRTLLGIVAVDDAWGLLVFAAMLAGASAVVGRGDLTAALLHGAWDVGGALLLGVALGVPTGLLTGRIQPGEPTLLEALGVVLLCGGLATWFDVSFLLASMVLGAVLANAARHHTRPFHAIEGIEQPFLILFFVLCGASLEPDSLADIGLFGAGYVALRVLGRLLGAQIGGLLSSATPAQRRWTGVAIMPQAGVALGMALLGAERIPSVADILLPIVIGATVLFELVGPILTRTALVRVGEVERG